MEELPKDLLSGYRVGLGSDSHSKLLKTLEELTKGRLLGSRELTGDQALAHQEVLEEIRSQFPEWNIKRKVLSGPFVYSSGALVTLDDGKKHIIVDSEIADYTLDRQHLEGFSMRDSPRRVTGRDVLKTVIAHEYGHIYLNEVSSRLPFRLSVPYSTDPTPSSEEDEGFAFWFGDTMTGVKSPLDVLKSGYLKRGIDFDQSITIYHRLEDQAKEKGISEILRPHNLADLLMKGRPKPKSERTLDFLS